MLEVCLAARLATPIMNALGTANMHVHDCIKILNVGKQYLNVMIFKEVDTLVIIRAQVSCKSFYMI